VVIGECSEWSCKPPALIIDYVLASDGCSWGGWLVGWVCRWIQGWFAGAATGCSCFVRFEVGARENSDAVQFRAGGKQCRFCRTTTVIAAVVKEYVKEHTHWATLPQCCHPGALGEDVDVVVDNAAWRPMGLRGHTCHRLKMWYQRKIHTRGKTIGNCLMVYLWGTWSVLQAEHTC
jgi:hypothetical protein